MIASKQTTMTINVLFTNSVSLWFRHQTVHCRSLISFTCVWRNFDRSVMCNWPPAHFHPEQSRVLAENSRNCRPKPMSFDRKRRYNVPTFHEKLIVSLVIEVRQLTEFVLTLKIDVNKRPAWNIGNDFIPPDASSFKGQWGLRHHQLR